MSLHHDILFTALLAAVLVGVCRLVLARRSAPTSDLRPLTSLPAPRAIPSRFATALKPEEYARVWREVRATDVLYLAVQQLIALETVTAIDEAADPRLCDKPGALAAASARMNALLELSAAIEKAATEGVNREKK